jgi:hypothetical protein
VVGIPRATIHYVSSNLIVRVVTLPIDCMGDPMLFVSRVQVSEGL